MRSALAITAAVLATLTPACDKPGAMGDANSIIVAASPELWQQVRDTIQTALEPRIRTVRDERMFKVTYQDPSQAHWGNLSKFKQLLLVGDPSEEWLQPAVREAGTLPEPPAIAEARNVWARGQSVTLLLVPGEGSPGAVGALLPELQDRYQRMYRQWTTNRMFISGQDTALADTLRSEAGFSLLLPRVYEWRRSDSVYVFRNDNPDPSELIREVAVTWRSPVPAELPGAEELLAWREEVASGSYEYPQDVDGSSAETSQVSQVRHQGTEGVQLQAVWQNPPGSDWPAAGPFLLRALPCPSQDRLYLLDAWLYAPGKEKYEYMIQLETILDSFRCGGA